MSLNRGTHLGCYEIVGSIGAGGMGEVYRARDTKLGRDVAIKVLPDLLAADRDRLERFDREATTLASLNHPNIAQIYGVEESPAVGRALVMELVDGETLEQTIARGPLSVPDALRVARQVAEALEAAHERGIIHRDLKPANVKIRPDGTVKVLDFGLAKAIASSPEGLADVMNSPTLTVRGTQMGMILGTAAYMAPEQAKGKTVDRRADIFAFGVMVYEMLTGRMLFAAESVAETLSNVMTRDPDLAALPAALPAAVRELLVRCLVKDPRERLRDIGDARIILGDALLLGGRASGVMAPPPRLTASSRLAWVLSAVAVLVALGFAVLWLRAGASAAAPKLTASLAPPPDTTLGASFALSPDGQRLVMEATAVGSGESALWVRDMGTGVFTKLPQTVSGIEPFWSPDGRQVGFFADGKLKRIDVQGGPSQIIADAPTPRGASWGPGDRIVFSGTFRAGLQVVDAAGGSLKTLSTMANGEKSHRWPLFLPDGKHVLFLAQTAEGGSKDDASTIEVLSIETGERRRLVVSNSSPLYSPSGFLMFWREGALLGQRFDARRLEISGDPFLVASSVAYDLNERIVATLALNDRLVYLPGGLSGRSSIEWVDRAGRGVSSIAGPVLVEGEMTLSHDGKRLAVAITADGASGGDIWLYDFGRATSTRLTFEDRDDTNPVWAGDDRQILYANNRVNDGIVFRRPSDGGGIPEQVFSNAQGAIPTAWSRDGRWAVLQITTAKTDSDLMRFDFGTKTLTPLVESPFEDIAGAISPDERWLAFASSRTGRREVFVQSLSGGGLWQVSTDGGEAPLWSHDGRELYFIALPDRLMTAEVLPSPGAFTSKAPRELFRAPFDGGNSVPYAVAPDGQRFVVMLKEQRSQVALLTVLSSWR